MSDTPKPLTMPPYHFQKPQFGTVCSSAELMDPPILGAEPMHWKEEKIRNYEASKAMANAISKLKG